MKRSIYILLNSFLTTLMKTRNIRVFLLTVVILYLCSCTTPPKAEKGATPKKPEITIQIASINLANLNKRIGRNNIIELVKILKNEQVDIFAVQGISRYPGIAARVDFVNELSAKTDWRNVFGEMLNISGRQTGNAIFSVYPILSHQNISWNRVISASFDAALLATIDAGVRPLMIVSTQLPPKASAHGQARCLKMIASMNPDTTDQLTIVAGNMPTDEIIRTTNSFAEVPSLEFAKRATPRIWYSANKSIQLFASRSVETELGTLVIAQFGLLRQQNH
jgi:endonuclease/exonuclease/phosphatase family metal-dependent hydrolase